MPIDKADAMTRLATTFDALRSAGRKGLVVYLTAGDPDFATSLAAAQSAVAAGADLLEIGVPFSDPTADGPVIQRAMQRALAAGGGFAQALELVRALRRELPTLPLVLFGYANPLLWNGLETSCAQAAAAGVDGLLVVDVPPEESEPYRAAAGATGLDWVSLVAPTTPAARARAIAEQASGFVYAVSMTGVTGGALADVGAIARTLREVRAVSTLPTCVGFGVRDEASAARAAAIADGVVVGSAVVAALEEALEQHGSDGPQRVAALVSRLRAGVDAASTREQAC